MYEVIYHDNIGPDHFSKRFDSREDAFRFADTEALSIAKEWHKAGIPATVVDYGWELDVYEPGGDRYAEFRFSWLYYR